MTTKTKPKRLPWEYCECGCHQSTFSAGPIQACILIDLNEKHEFVGCYLAFDSHYARGDGKRYDTFDDADAAVRARIREVLSELKDAARL